MERRKFARVIPRFFLLFFSMAAFLTVDAQMDTVISGGRVMDPESGLDAIRNVGIRDGKIISITEMEIRGTKIIDATGLVVTPRFIDLHQHAQDEQTYRFKALDGVTTALELEVGTADVDAWYAERRGTLQINHGVSVGHMKARMTVMGDNPSFLPGAKSGAAWTEANDKQLLPIKNGIRKGLDRGAVAVGFGIAHPPPWRHGRKSWRCSRSPPNATLRATCICGPPTTWNPAPSPPCRSC